MAEINPRESGGVQPPAQEKKHNFKPDVEAQLMQAFETIDENGDGTLEAMELKQVLDAVSEGQKPYELEEVEAIIATVDVDGSGSIQKDEFLEFVWNEVEKNKPAEPFVELFKSFGAASDQDVITIATFQEALKAGDEALSEQQLNMIFEELAGQTKRQSMDPEKKYER